VVTDPDKLKPLKATVLGIFGEEDRGIPPSAVRKFKNALKKAGKKVYRIETFKAGHAFMRPGTDSHPNPAYRKKEAEKAWQSIDKFLAATLKGK
jgi:carboxymethylenebutenolidase